MLREAAQLRRQNRVPEAIEAYRRVLARWPGQAESWFNLAVLQRQAHRFEEALESYQRALDAGVSRPEEAHLNRSVIYTDYLRRYAEAERELRLALSLNPAFIPALLNLGNLCEDLGRRAEALALYAQILEREPRCFEALARYANMQPRDAADPALSQRLKHAIADPAASAAERASVGFALGRLLDRRGEYPAAFAAYRAANQASRASVGPQGARYDRARQHAFVDRLIAGGPPTRRASGASDPAAEPDIHLRHVSFGLDIDRAVAGRLHRSCRRRRARFPAPPGRRTELAPFPESLAALSAERLGSPRRRATARNSRECRSTPAT